MVKFGWKRKGIRYDKREKDIDPDEIFIDSSNLPNFDTNQFEGRLEKSISRRSLYILGLAFFLIIIIFVGRVWYLQIKEGGTYFIKSENNRLRNSLVFAKRGVIYDREGTKLAWNVENTESNAYDLRKYIPLDGLAHLLGYLKYPAKDSSGFYYSEVFIGKDGVERIYNDLLSGDNGKRIVEVDALGKIQAENIVRQPKDGEDLKLSIDASVQNKMFTEIKGLASRAGFSGGAGVIMDVKTGEILAMTSYPEYNSQIMTDGQNKSVINNYLTDKKSTPLLNRVVNGLYTPGSTVKPFMAFAALAENIIDPYTNIYSSGSISLPNPYDASKPTIFKDWKAHGYVDMKRALAVSSDVYFYEVGGGFENQKGLGIANIDKYMKMFGFGSRVPSVSASSTDPTFSLFYGPTGDIPTPEWKAEHFDGEDWRVGDTYHTSIGQYGFQVSPVQLVRAVSALANGGTLVSPKILLNEDNHNLSINLNLNQANLKIVRDGMRDGVIKDYGVAKGLNSIDYSVAAKTGTAELGVYKQYVNSWISGFFPYEDPKYAFVVIMEKGPVANTTGALYVMRQVLDYLAVYKQNYLK
jgi:penicillin-binding protein 2